MTKSHIKQLEKQVRALNPYRCQGMDLDMLSIPTAGMMWKKTRDLEPFRALPGKQASIEEIMKPRAEYVLVPEDMENEVLQ